LNYSGKFDAKVPIDDSDLHSNGHVHVDTFSAHATHAPVDAIVVPDAHLLFNGDFKRSGVDLVLSKDDQELVLHDYFKGEKRVALASPDGAHLTGDIVNALTGHVEYAQADGSAGVGKVIGHVTKLVGTATAVRNGVSIILNQGDNVEKGDVVQSGSGSTLGITFIDGTVFGLSSNARMVLNEMVYDPNGSNNSSLLSLVAGTITFVAGETAKHGDMKIDTPVATMGIRGTAVLVEIDFDVPGQAGLPDAKFQVLVEPDGTTGSYILFDKTTLTPLAVVDKAGQQINISNGTLSLSSTGLSSEIQKLITDVFSIKFSDNNTKTFDHHTDTPIPDSLSPLKVGVITALPIVLQLPAAVDPAPSNSVVLPNANVHINQAPTAVMLNASGHAVTAFQITELPAVTHSSALDTASGKVSFVDINVGDAPTVSAKFASFTYQNAAHTDVTAMLSAQQLADIAAVEAKLAIVPDPGNSYFGSATWTYGVPDSAFDFLAAGETLTLTYTAYVDNNYKQSDLVTPITFTITITGTNDVPVITSPQQNINFVSAGTDTKGGELIPNTATAGKLTFTDPDLTDTHTVAVKMTSALLDGQSFATTVGPVVIDELAAALTAKITTADDTTGTGTGTVEWALANLQVYLADLVPANETLVLTYAVTVTDSQNATSTQDIVVTISGNNGAAVVWTDTNPIPPGGALWSVASNWEGDRTPNSNGFSDDVFIGTDQVLPATPTFPVTVDAMAAAKSLTMDYFADFGTAIPELDVEPTGSLTIAGTLNLDTSTDPLSPLTAESIIKNFGNISVGGIAKLLKHSVLDNYGTITLAQGGVFGDQSSITNSGTIELTGGTLAVEVAVANTGGTIKVDVGATASGTVLQLDDNAVVSNGNLTIGSHSKLDVEKGAATLSAGTPDATLDGVSVNGTGTTGLSASLIEIGASSPSGSILTLEDGTTIKHGTLTIAGGSTLDIEKGAATLVAGAPDATLDGATVIGTGTTGSTATLIEVGVHTTSGSILTLDDGTTITNGTLTIAGGSTLDVESSTGATLDNVTVTDSGTIQVDVPSSSASATLNLDGGTSVTGGNLSIGPVGTLVIQVGSGGSSVTLDGVKVSNGGHIDVGTAASGVTLTLDDGSSIKNGTLVFGDSSDKVLVGSGGATLDDVGVTGGGETDVSSTTATGVTLTLDDGSSIKNGSLVFGGSSDKVLVGSGGATLDGVAVTGGGETDVGSTTATGVTLTLDDGSSIKNGTLVFGDSSDKVLVGSGGATLDDVGVTGGGAIDVGSTAASGVTLTLDDGSSITGGTLVFGDSSDKVSVGSGGATLDDVGVTGGGAVDVGSTAASGVTLTLDDGSAITGGRLTIAGGSTLDVESTGGATLDGVTVTGSNAVIGPPAAAASLIEIGASTPGSILMLDDATSIKNGNLTIAGGSKLDVESTGGATLDGVSVTGTTGPTASLIEIGGSTASGSILTLDDGTSIKNGGLTIAGSSKLDVESTGGATLDGVTVTGTAGSTASLIEIGASTASGSILTLYDATSIKNGGLTIAGGSTLDVESTGGATLDGVSVTGTTGPTASLIEIGASTTSGSILTLDDATSIKNGGLTIAGGSTLDVESSTGATLDAVSVTGTTGPKAGLIEIGAHTTSGSILTLDDGTSIKNGGLTIAGGSTLDVENSVTGTGATLDGVSVMNSGSIQVDSPVSGTTTVTLVLDDGTTVTGGTLKIHVLGSSAEGIVEIATGGATLDSVTVENNNSLLIDSSVTLTLDDSTTISGGIITDSGTIHVTGPTEISSASLNIAAGGFLLVDSSEILKLDCVTATGGTINDNGTIDVVGSSSINGTTSGAPPATTNAILNDGGVTIESGVTLTLDNVTVTGTVFTDIATSSTIKVGSGDTLAFNGATIDGGTLNVLGEMDSSGVSFITGATIVNVNHIVVVSGTLTIDPTPVANTGTIEVMGGGSLKLSDDIITNTDGTTNGIIQVDADPIDPATLDLDKSTISGGTVNISGVLDSSRDSFITGAKITNSGTIDVTSGTLVIDATSTLDNTGGTLKSDGGNLIVDTALSGNLEIKGGAVLELGASSPTAYSSATVTFEPGATGTLKLDHSENFGGTVVGLDDNTIDLLDISSVNAVGTTVLPTVTFDSKTDILTITSNVQLTQVAHIQLTGDYTGVAWSVTNDGNGRTDVTEVPGVIAGLDSNGNATEGSPIKASITDGGAAVTATYTWQIFENGAWVPGSGVADANGNYTPGEADEGHALRVSISYIDALNHSETATVSAGTVIGVPETPVVSTPDAKITTENHAAIALTGLSVTPADASANDAADTFNVTLSVKDGSLALAGDSGLSGTFSGASITFSGSLAAVNAALSGVSYTPNSEFEGQDTLTFTSSATEEASAGGGTSAAATQTATIIVNPVAEAGTASAPATLTLTENATNVAITGVVVGPLAEDSDDTVRAALTVGHGTVHVNNTNLPADVTVTGDDSGSLTISGNAAAVNTLLAGLTYTPTTEFNGSDTLHVTVTSIDGSNTSATQGTASTAITVSDGANDLVATLNHTTAQEGVAITVTEVTDGGTPVTTGLSYVWEVSNGQGGWTPVGGNSASYTPTEADEGKTLQLVVTYVDAGGSESSIYSLGMPNDLTATVDSTTAQQGLAIHVTGVSDGGTSISTSSNDLGYAWQHSSDNGETWQTVGTSKSYTPTSTDAGDLLRVVVTYADSDEQESVTTSFGTVAPAKEWLGGNHDWQTGSQWATSGVPTNNDNAVVDAGGFYVVKIDQAAAAHSLVVNDFWATVEILAGNTLTLGGNATIEAGILLVDSGATLKDIAPSATIGGTLFIDNGTVEAAGGKLEIASAVNFSVGNFKIDVGAALQFDHADALNVAFTGSGVLILNDPTHFSGTISDSGGSMTAADVLDLHGFAAATTTASTGNGSFNSTTDTTTLTVTDSSDHLTETFTLAGNLSGSTWTVTNDGNGGANVVDPPAPANLAVVPTAVLNQAASSTIVVSGPNQMLTGNAVSDTFAFNFANVGHATVTDFHPATDTLQFSSQLFANIQAALNATHDDGHGNAVIALDAHDTITLSGILKAQLHASDFHFV
jgi:FecR protein